MPQPQPAAAASTPPGGYPSERVGAASITTTSGSTSGYGAGVNPMRATSDESTDLARSAATQRAQLEERGVAPYNTTAPAPGNVGATVAGGGPPRPA
jgi:hypothetical protein